MTGDPAVPAQTSDPDSEPDTRNRPGDSEDQADAVESGGPAGPEPTRFGDWERNGRCIDF